MLRNKTTTLIAFLLVAFFAIYVFKILFQLPSAAPVKKTASEAPVVTAPAKLPSLPEQNFATNQSTHPAEKAPASPPSASQAPRPRQLVVKGIYNPPPLEGPHAAELTRIQDLSVTYDAREVPALAAFLTHDSAEVRAAALDGLVRLGAKEAAEPLRAAAGKVKDPREAIAMLDAADYLELPPMPASMLRKRKESKTSAAPGPASSEHKKTTAVGGG